MGTTDPPGKLWTHQWAITDDSDDDDYQYDKVPTDDELRLEKDVEDLLEAWRISQKQAEDAPVLQPNGKVLFPALFPTSSLSWSLISKVCQAVQTSEKPVLEIYEAVDDVFCRFLDRLGMSRTLNCFQAEWHEFIEKGVIKTEDTGLVPTVLVHNQQLEDENMLLRRELGNYKFALSKAKETMVKLHRERNFHRMRHDQLIQEKKRFICDMKRLRAHCAELNQMTEKYKTVLKQKKVISLQRDRAVGQATDLQAKSQNLESAGAIQMPVKKATFDGEVGLKETRFSERLLKIDEIMKNGTVSSTHFGNR